MIEPLKNKKNIKGKCEVEECFIISRWAGKNIFVVKSFNKERVVCPSFAILKKFINKELSKLKNE